MCSGACEAWSVVVEVLLLLALPTEIIIIPCLLKGSPERQLAVSGATDVSARPGTGLSSPSRDELGTGV